jgi:alkanesulfonate monooxygenase SsuD/methylene tetrahydromethanopterin reductase-like flavin-dependent oxidoreductase (luciferase family)
MKYAIDIPHFGEFADPMVLAGLAQTAEAAGWDGFFIWDHVAAYTVGLRSDCSGEIKKATRLLFQQ